MKTPIVLKSFEALSFAVFAKGAQTGGEEGRAGSNVAPTAAAQPQPVPSQAIHIPHDSKYLLMPGQPTDWLDTVNSALNDIYL
jgi:hypothetical protein